MESRPTHPPRESYVELRARPEPELLAARVASPPPARGVTAVIVSHGMGQQVRFETLEQVANALRGEDAARHGRPHGPRITVDEVMLGETRLARAEMRVTGKDGAAREVHLYEAYWAPVTEGRVSLMDVIAFLLRSGFHSLRAVADPTFDRWMFGRWVRFAIHRFRTALEVSGVMLVLLSLILINTLVTAVLATHSLTGGTIAWPKPNLFRQLTLDLSLVFVAVIAIVLGAMFVPRWMRPKMPRAGEKGLRAGSLVGWALVALGFGGVVAIAVFMVIHVLSSPGKLTQMPMFGGPGPLKGRETLEAWVVWGAALWVSFQARGFLVEYVGDVAAYVSAHTVSKFWDMRHQIHEISMEVARAVYGARAPNGRDPAYDRIVVVGHSLGSVVAYDMLNDVILEDRLKQLPFDAAHRTEMMLTFGSPLEKTAYLFRTQRPHTAEVREALAAAVQPMIQSYVSRPRFWVNLSSPNDIISAPLRFYDAEDPPEGGSRRVENVTDPDADLPLLGHNQYWTSPTFAAALHDGVTGDWTPGVKGSQAPRAADPRQS